MGQAMSFKIDYGLSCGRAYLHINNMILVVEGDKIHDLELIKVNKILLDRNYPGHPECFNNVWSMNLIQYIVKGYGE